ncbi:MAG: hypothetical protein OEM62_03625 [Acidobacteriota bacterium]|nr:hypothetical protein [Acidobacteriota bacterium]
MKHERTLVCAVLLLTAFALPTLAAEPEEVRVVNFPEIQPIRGTVEIGKPAPGTTLVSISEAVVAPADPDRITNLVAAGLLTAHGFRSGVLSLAGQIKSNYPGDGTVGALLVPDLPFFKAAFEEDGETLLTLRVEAPVSAETGTYFAISLPPAELAFPSYRVYFFNTTDLPASVTLYGYLAN